MLGKFFDKLLHEDESELHKEAGGRDKEKEKVEKREEKRSTWEILLVIVIILLGLAYRVYFIYFVSSPENAGVGWYGDTYHHWQIAYLTKEIGLGEGFLRLWDLKGMEYFWGPLHPILMIAAFNITGSVSIVLTRLVSSIFGLFSIYLVYLLARRYWGKTVALASLLFAALFPIAVFNDASGMLEPIGIFFLFLGIYLWRKRPVFAGLSWALATMVRAEAWIFSSVLVLAIIFFKKVDSNKKVMVSLGFLVPMIFYMKYLLDHTGNPIYPVWWNYLANARGVWAGGADLHFTELQLFIKPFLIGTGVLALGALIWVFYKKPKALLFQIVGWGNILFLGFFMGLSHYLKGWEWWFPVIRFFVFPYIFIATIILALFKSEGKTHKLSWNILVWAVSAILIISTQLTWIPIWSRYKETIPPWQTAKQWGQTVGSHYEVGTLLFPEHDPHFTYMTVMEGGIVGEYILGQMFDPYFYFEGDPYDNWGENREVVLSWLKDNDVSLAVVRNDAERYQQLFERESKLFEKVDTLEGGVYEVWNVYPERIKQENGF